MQAPAPSVRDVERNIRASARVSEQLLNMRRAAMIKSTDKAQQI
jgi:hypothetical protein